MYTPKWCRWFSCCSTKPTSTCKSTIGNATKFDGGRVRNVVLRTMRYRERLQSALLAHAVVLGTECIATCLPQLKGTAPWHVKRREGRGKSWTAGRAVPKQANSGCEAGNDYVHTKVVHRLTNAYMCSLIAALCCLLFLARLASHAVSAAAGGGVLLLLLLP
jgi:hypothetical protein